RVWKIWRSTEAKAQPCHGARGKRASWHWCLAENRLSVWIEVRQCCTEKASSFRRHPESRVRFVGQNKRHSHPRLPCARLIGTPIRGDRRAEHQLPRGR